MEAQEAALTYYAKPYALVSEKAEIKFQDIIERATIDPDFRRRLLDAPKEVLTEEFGDDAINPEATFRVVDGNDADVTLVLPEPIGVTTELSDDDLDSVAGGAGSCVMFSDWTSFGCTNPE